jgi:predicted nucleotidyltransferase component of viral defense system
MCDDPLLSGTLALGGGTALNMLHVSPTPRLSEDLDFNFRHVEERDWGIVRDDVDRRLKGVLYGLGYTRDDVRIQAKWNLGRFHVHYRALTGTIGSLKVEIGYMRRMPILEGDIRLPFVHPIHGTEAMVKTPQREEQFASKVCTLVSRKGEYSYPRDHFDVRTISLQEFDWDLLVDLVMIDSLMDGLNLESVRPRPPDLDHVAMLNRMLRGRADVAAVVAVATDFFERVRLAAVDRGWSEFSDTFKRTGVVKIDLLKNPSRINPRISEHPELLWVRRPKADGEPRGR